MGILTLKYPVEQGKVVNWDDWEKTLHSSFYDCLRIAPEEHRVVMVLPPEWPNTRAELEKLTQIMFETFCVPELLLLPNDVSAALAVKAAEPVLVLHSGFDVTTATVVVDFKSEKRSLSQRKIGGSHVTGAFVEMVKGQLTDTFIGTRVAYDLGQSALQVCFVAPQPIGIWRSAFAKSCPAKPMMLNDEQLVLTTELFECTEILFSDPTANVVDLCLECISKSDCFPGKIVLDGGNTQWPGFAARLELELRLRGSQLSVVNTKGDRAHLAWCGASLASSQKSVQSKLILTKEEYDFEGPVAIHKVFDGHFF